MSRKSVPNSAILENALDSLRIGMEFFQRDSSYSTHKHAILTIFHAIELFLKERLHRVNRVLIYKYIDKKLTDDAHTVTLAEAIIRLENIGISLPDDQKVIIGKIQLRRNRIEHHRYDHNEKEDVIIIAEALKFILYFTELSLNVQLGEFIDRELLLGMKRRVLDYNERFAFAESRFEDWAKKQWPTWDITTEDIPEEFAGTHDCPECGQSWLLIGYHPQPFCFSCNMPVDALICENCGRSHFATDICCLAELEDTSFGS